MDKKIKKRPPDSPGDQDRGSWRRDRQEWAIGTWKPIEDENDETGRQAAAESLHDDFNPEGGPPDTRHEEELDDKSCDDDSYEVEGKLRPLIEEGERLMVCYDHELRNTRFGPKDYLLWADEDGSLFLEQFFPHPPDGKYRMNHKAIIDYITAMGHRPKRLDRFSFRRFIRLCAIVYVETVKPKFAEGALKGTIKPEVHFYSKVSHLLVPGCRVEPATIKFLRSVCK